MPEIEILSTGILFRNPKAHLRSEHAYFPSVVHLGGHEMLAVFVVGSAFEAVDCHTVVARSQDDGKTWTREGTLQPGAPLPAMSDTFRIAKIGNEIVAFGARHIREDPDEGLTNPRNMGFVPTELALYRSNDKGRTWIGPEIVEPPLTGPSFEICSPIVPLSDGRWFAPTSTWTGWNGECPNGMKAIALISHDRGRTWPEYADIMDGTAEDVIYWEQGVTPLPGNRVVSAAWTYDRRNNIDRDISCAVSTDNGRSFGRPRSTGLKGQTVRTLAVGDDALLVIYRRTDEKGLWAAVASVKDDRWTTLVQMPVWQGASAGSKDRNSMVEEFHHLKFGAPSVVPMPDGTVYVAFWCVEDCISNIRWFRLKVGT